jgi:hypothetical protein
MNTKLVGGVLLVGGVSVIAYYFLFLKDKKKQKELATAKSEQALSDIKADLSLAENPNKNNPLNVNNFNPYSFDMVFTPQEAKALQDKFKDIGAYDATKINYDPNVIDFSGLEKLGLANLDMAKVEAYLSGKQPLLP